MEWWSDEVFKIINEAMYNLPHFSITPVPQCSNTPKIGMLV